MPPFHLSPHLHTRHTQYGLYHQLGNSLDKEKKGNTYVIITPWCPLDIILRERRCTPAFANEEETTSSKHWKCSYGTRLL